MSDQKNAKYQKEFRERKKADGKTELRGVYVKKEHHPRVKAKARDEAERLESLTDIVNTQEHW